MKFLTLLLVILVGCSTTPTQTRLTKDKITNNATVVFGKISDLNPNADLTKLTITYTLSDKSEKGVLNFDNKVPKIDPHTGYFWVAIPNDEVTYFGIKSIRYGIKGMTSEPIIRDEVNHKALYGINLLGRNGAVYIGEITIRSFTRKLNPNLNIDVADIKEISIKNNANAAKEFLGKLGVEPSQMMVNTLSTVKKI